MRDLRGNGYYTKPSMSLIPVYCCLLIAIEKRKGVVYLLLVWPRLARDYRKTAQLLPLVRFEVIAPLLKK